MNEKIVQPKKWIGVIHLPPLPDSPGYSGNWEQSIHLAIEEAKLFQKAGAWGVIVENYGDAPFYPAKVPPITPSCLAILAYEIRKQTSLEVGINCLRNDAVSALGAAVASGCSFIRVNIWSGVYATDQGLLSGIAHTVLRLRKQWSPDTPVRIFADFHVKHATPLFKQELSEAFQSFIERSLPDAVLLTGSSTGRAPTLDEVKMLSHLCPEGIELYIASGMTPENIHNYFHYVDGVIVSSALRKEGKAGFPLDEQRLRLWGKTWTNIHS